MKTKLILLCLAILLAMSAANAQKRTEDVVYLKTGSVVRGQLLEVKPNESVRFESADGSVWVFEMDQVERIVSEPIAKPAKVLDVPKNSGLYHQSSFSLQPGASFSNEMNFGFGFNHVTGWRLNHWVGLGLGTGLESMSTDQWFVPLYAEFRGSVLNKSFSPIYSFGGGYSFPVAGKGLAPKGGMYLHPAVGLRFASKSKAHITADFGLKIQQAQYHPNDWWWGGGDVVQEYTFWRYVLRVGVAF